MPGGTFFWRLPQWAEDDFQEMLNQLADLDEFDDEAMALQDRIRSLPGFPIDATEDDMIYREITTVFAN